MSQTNSYQLLLDNLDQFIRKFYLNRIIKGSLFTLATIGAIFLIFSILEYYFYFSPSVRKVLFYSFLATSLGSLFYWVIQPATKYFRLGAALSHEQAAQIIGDHFPNVSDKLLNILQLKRQSSSLADRSLIEASILQKSDEIKLVRFPKAINLSKNRKYLRYALPPLVIIFGLLLTAPSVLTDSTDRIIRNNEEFSPAAPFHFVIKNSDLEVPQYDNFELEVITEGQVAPEEVFVSMDDKRFRLTQKQPGVFSYVFNTVQNDLHFRLSSGPVESSTYQLKVLLKPQLSTFSTRIDYPSYTGYQDETKENLGDLSLPEGSRVVWTFDTQHADSLFIRFGGGKRDALRKMADNVFSLSKRLTQSMLYRPIFTNSLSQQSDSVSYGIKIIKDQYPSISVKSFEDSLDQKFIIFAGESADDYGLSKLLFHYQITDAEGQTKAWQSTPVPINLKKASTFQHEVLLEKLDMGLGHKLDYYFEVFDNDGVNGAKSTRTRAETFSLASEDELEKMSEENSKEIKQKLEDNIDRAKEIQEELKKLREKLLNNKNPQWEDKKKLEELIQEQQKLKEQFQQAQEQLEQNMKNQESLQQNHEELQQKQEKLQELFNEVIDKDMQQLMEDIQKLMEDLEKENLTQEMQDMEMSEEDLEKDMDRLLELYKQLEVEKDIRDQIEKLEEMAKKQEELSKKTEQQNGDNEELQKEQEELKKEMEEFEKKQEEIEKKNEELEKPKDLDDTKKDSEDVKKDMDDAQEQMGQKQNSKASKSQKKASDKMKEMAAGMQESMESQEQSQQAEDIKTLRQLLENLVSLSFDQEDLVADVKSTNPSTPRYVELTQVQFKLQDDFGLIEDSLQALAKRNIQIESYITDKVNEITHLFEKTVDVLEQRSVGKANQNQRSIMKNTNDLALMLSESLNEMQKQMASMMKGNQMCNNPGGSSGKNGKVPMDKISEGQDKLGDQLQKMKEGMKKGQGKKGEMSKEFAQAAARQAAMRRALEKLQEEKKEQGQGSPELQEIIDEMDKMEIDLLNKRLDNEALKRQNNITTRLLEAEKAERQRELDNKRKSTTAEEVERKLPPSLEKYLKERESEIDLYQKVSPELRPYYKALVEEYYKNLKQ